MKILSLCSIIAFLLVISQTAVTAPRFEHYQYLSPQPGSTDISAEVEILIRFEDVALQDLTNLSTFIEVKSQNGTAYSGRTRVASDGKTVIFHPDTHFPPGESVSVSLAPAVTSGAPCDVLSYRFTISEWEQKAYSSMSEQGLKKVNVSRAVNENVESYGRAMSLDNGISVPSDFPNIYITINDDPDSGYIFCNNWGGQPYNVIFDNTGQPVWYLRTPDRRRDFKVQKNGLITMLVRPESGYPFGQGYIAMDSTYTIVNTYHAVDGYATDEHELQVLEDGHYLLIGIRQTRVDMSQYVEGGRRSATVSTSVLQEFTPEGDLVLLWDPWDEGHMDIAATGVPGENDLTGGNIRFPHMNAIDVDEDGNLLLSSRHASEVTKINRQTGEVIWRLSGENNQFTFVNDPFNGFENQHDVRVVGPNRITVFDNGNEHNPRVSRAVEYEIDPDSKTATLVWEFRDTPDKYSHYMGNVQRLPNGNTLINWAEGYLPKLTEVTPDGRKAFEMNWVYYFDTYRVFRFPWHGAAAKPYLILEPHKESIILLINKFGDKNIDYFNIYGGRSANPTAVIDTSHSTIKMLTDLENEVRYYFRVTAVDINGIESDFSNEENALVNFIDAGQNMVLNGDFEGRKRDWYFGAFEPAAAQFSVEDEVAHIEITAAGTESSQIQLVQPEMELLQGEEYLFEFDAWADTVRTMEAILLKGSEPYTNYGRIGVTALKSRLQHYSYRFTMEDPSDFFAYIVFFLAGDDADVYVDNVSLKRVVETGAISSAEPPPEKYELGANYPNPFNPVTRIEYRLARPAHVTLEVYNILGERLQTLVNNRQNSGVHKIDFDASEFSSGVYLYSIRVNGDADELLFRRTYKMTVIK